jgi:hypothetical protein
MELGNGHHAAASAASFLNGMPDAYSPENSEDIGRRDSSYCIGRSLCPRLGGAVRMNWALLILLAIVFLLIVFQPGDGV